MKKATIDLSIITPYLETLRNPSDYEGGKQLSVCFELSQVICLFTKKKTWIWPDNCEDEVRKLLIKAGFDESKYTVEVVNFFCNCECYEVFIEGREVAE